MTPVKQEFLHNPEAGVFGDCQRACVASLLDLPISVVPHFLFDNTQDGFEFNRRINAFLSKFGLMHLETTPVVFAELDFPGDCYHMIYGPASRGVRHAVVGVNGRIVHDPHPSNEGLLADRIDEWTFGFLVCTDLGSLLVEATP